MRRLASVPTVMIASRWAVALSLGAAIALVCGTAGTVRGAEPICQSPDVIFCEDFDSVDWASRWHEISHRDRKVRDTNPPVRPPLPSQASLRLTFPPGDQNGGGWMHYWWTPGPAQGSIYLRWYVMYGSNFDWGHGDVKLAGVDGHLPGVRYGPGAGVRPDGTWFSNRLVSLGVPDSRGAPSAREPFFYYYHMDQATQWGDFGFQNQGAHVAFERGRWYCLEMMTRPNDIGQANGEMLMWVDGVLKARHVGIRWRSRSDAQINNLFLSAWIGEPRHSETQYRWEDNYVVSRSRIGCGSTIEPPQPPTNLRLR